MKIKGIPVGTTMPRPDWDQTNPAKADFIKNKPVPDASLTQEGKPADAKATGEAISAVCLTATDDGNGVVTLAHGGEVEGGGSGNEPTEPKVYYNNDFNTNADGITFEMVGSTGSSIMYSEHKVNASGNGYLYLNSSNNNNPVAYWNKGENGLAVQALPEAFEMSFDVAILAGHANRQFFVTLYDENGKSFNTLDIKDTTLRALYKNDAGNKSHNVGIYASESEDNPTYNSITMAFDMAANTYTISFTASDGTPREYADLGFRIPADFGTLQYIGFKARNGDVAENTGAFLLDNLKIYGDAPVEEKKPLKAIRFPGLDGRYSVAPGGYGYGDTIKCYNWTEDEAAFDAELNAIYNAMPDDCVKQILCVDSSISLSLCACTLTKASSTQGVLSGVDTRRGSRVQKVRSGDGWSEWEWENPPFELGVEYRTTKRWQGYPLYQMLVEFGAPPLSTSKEVRTNVPSNTWRIGFERRLARADGDCACYGQEVPSIIKEYIYNSGDTCIISITTGDSELQGYHMYYLVTYAY